MQDARQAESLEEAMWRVQAFADAGADMLFVDALESEEEMRLFCRVAGSVPKVCVSRGEGRWPIIPEDQPLLLVIPLVHQLPLPPRWHQPSESHADIS